MSSCDALNVEEFAVEMLAKLDANRDKFGDQWRDVEKCPTEHLQSMLISCVIKGDPVDVANLAMMLAQRGASTDLHALKVQYMVMVSDALDTWRVVDMETYCAVQALGTHPVKIVYVTGQR